MSRGNRGRGRDEIEGAQAQRTFCPDQLGRVLRAFHHRWFQQVPGTVRGFSPAALTQDALSSDGFSTPPACSSGPEP